MKSKQAPPETTMAPNTNPPELSDYSDEVTEEAIERIRAMVTIPPGKRTITSSLLDPNFGLDLET